MTIGILGLGLIGGSIAFDLVSQIHITVLGYDINDAHQQKALELGLVHKIVSFDRLWIDCDIVIIGTPVDKIENILATILSKPLVRPHITIIDVGSTKQKICSAVKDLPNRSRYVAAHPLAGTEFSGPEAALKNLFLGKKNIICHKELSSEDALERALMLFRSIGMHTIFMSAEEHDRHLAYVSHLSHVSSFMLGLTVLDIENDEKQIFNLASTGFESTVRLAKSNPSTWSAIFLKNKDYVLEALNSYIDHLNVFKTALHNEDVSQLLASMSRSNDIKKILKS